MFRVWLPLHECQSVFADCQTGRWKDLSVSVAGCTDTVLPCSWATTGEDCLQIRSVVDDKIEGFQFAVTSGIHEIDHLHSILLNETNDVGGVQYP